MEILPDEMEEMSPTTLIEIIRELEEENARLERMLMLTMERLTGVMNQNEDFKD
jgi:hypothetical protein